MTLLPADPALTSTVISPGSGSFQNQWSSTGISDGAPGCVMSLPATGGGAVDTGALALDVRGSVTGAQASYQVFAVSGWAPNAQNAALKVGHDGVTGRGITSGGSMIGLGADYAEYETKRPDCGIIAKGDIVGFDVDALVTDRWAYAAGSQFGIKSTSPAFVGGDAWGAGIGPKPTAPEAPVAPVDPKAPAGSAEETAYQTALAAYTTAETAYQTQLAAYNAALATWEAALEAARAKVDRIAYCGKVPLNMASTAGVNPGDYILAIEATDGSGGISAVHVAPAALTLAQRLAAVGVVRRVLSATQVEVAVVVG